MDVQISPDGAYLTLSAGSGKHRFHAVWLRDNARDESTLSIVNGQHYGGIGCL